MCKHPKYFKASQTLNLIKEALTKNNETIKKLRNLKRNFDIESFPSGKYNIDLELIYPGGIAVSGAFFRIISSF